MACEGHSIQARANRLPTASRTAFGEVGKSRATSAVFGPFGASDSLWQLFGLSLHQARPDVHHDEKFKPGIVDNDRRNIVMMSPAVLLPAAQLLQSAGVGGLS